MTLTSDLLVFVFLIYVVAFICYVLELTSIRRTQSHSLLAWAGRLIQGGFLIHTFEVFTHAFSATNIGDTRPYLPVGTLGENASFFAWSLAFVYLILVKRHQTDGFGLVLTPVLGLFLIPSFFSYPPATQLPYLNDSYFLLHILSAFFGYASFALSFIAGLLYLVQDRALKLKTHTDFYHKLPPLDALEYFIFRNVLWGLLLLGTAILSGAFWTKSAFGTFILAEPKSFAALGTWCVYLFLIYLHEVSAVKGRRMVLMSVWAFALVLFTFIGTSIAKTGLHVGV